MNMVNWSIWLTLIFAVCGLPYAIEGADEIKTLDLSKCPVQIEPIGCYGDKDNDRALPEEIMNSRDDRSATFTKPALKDHWRNFPQFLSNFICECAKKVIAENRGEHLGIQFYGECWSGHKGVGKNALSQHAKHGQSSSCINSHFVRYDGNRRGCEPYCGEQSTNYVYKITAYSEKPCPAYFKPAGCFRDNQVEPRPLPHYIMNERDYTHPNWNGRMIEWNQWDTYMPEMICRCALAAKSMNYTYFGIQFYGECWASNNASQINKDGNGNTDDCLRKLGMSPYGENCPSKEEDERSEECQPTLCVGKQFTNRVYELRQGPLSCLDNPCQRDEMCQPIGLKYECVKS